VAKQKILFPQFFIFLVTDRRQNCSFNGPMLNDSKAKVLSSLSNKIHLLWSGLSRLDTINTF